jgi:hypothetical protein
MARNRWSARRAARIGYLAGRGCSVEQVIADLKVDISLHAMRMLEKTWHIAFGLGSPFALLIAPDDLERLESAAELRGMTPATLAREILKRALRDNLVDAIIDERDAANGGASDAPRSAD